MGRFWIRCYLSKQTLLKHFVILSSPSGVLHQSDCHWAERTISRSRGAGWVEPTPNLIMEIGPNFNQQIRSRSALSFSSCSSGKVLPRLIANWKGKFRTKVLHCSQVTHIVFEDYFFRLRTLWPLFIEYALVLRWWAILFRKKTKSRKQKKVKEIRRICGKQSTPCIASCGLTIINVQWVWHICTSVFPVQEYKFNCEFDIAFNAR